MNTMPIGLTSWPRSWPITGQVKCVKTLTQAGQGVWKVSSLLLYKHFICILCTYVFWRYKYDIIYHLIIYLHLQCTIMPKWLQSILAVKFCFVNILLEHQFKSSTPGPENERVMIFYHEARVDGLVKREETQTEMTEEYSNRDDFLFYKYVEFGKRAKKFGPQETSSANKGRPINVILLIHCFTHIFPKSNSLLQSYPSLCVNLVCFSENDPEIP